MPYILSKDPRENNLFSGIIGFLDIIAGVLVYLSRSYDFSSNMLVMILSFIYFCVGLWSLITNILRKNYIDWKGIIDMISAISLFLVFSGSVYGIFEILGIIILLKGVIGLLLIMTTEY